MQSPLSRLLVCSCVLALGVSVAGNRIVGSVAIAQTQPDSRKAEADHLSKQAFQ
jgi:hypothetical protein